MWSGRLDIIYVTQDPATMQHEDYVIWLLVRACPAGALLDPLNQDFFPADIALNAIVLIGIAAHTG